MIGFYDTILLNVVKSLGARIVIVKLDLNDGSSKQGNARRAYPGYKKLNKQLQIHKHFLLLQIVCMHLYDFDLSFDKIHEVDHLFSH
jgi:hypothetical protein